MLVKVVGNGGVDGDKFLQASHAPEPLHRAPALSKQEVGILSPVVHPAASLLTIRTSSLFET